MKHDSMYMFCDSALIYEKINSVEAFGNVRMEQGDTLFIYGDNCCIENIQNYIANYEIGHDTFIENVDIILLSSFSSVSSVDIVLSRLSKYSSSVDISVLPVKILV